MAVGIVVKDSYLPTPVSFYANCFLGPQETHDPLVGGYGLCGLMTAK